VIPIRDINPSEKPPLMTGVLIIANLAAGISLLQVLVRRDLPARRRY
jgi:hypothetical protein